MNLTITEYVTLRALLNIHIRQLASISRHPGASVEDCQKYTRELVECEALAEKLRVASNQEEAA